MKTPNILDDAEVARLEARRRELRKERQQLQSEHDALVLEIEALGGRVLRSTMDSAAVALIAGESAAEPSAEDLRQRAGEISARLALLDRALGILAKEKERASSAASRRLCAEIRPVHAELARRVISAARELAAAMKAESDFRAELERGGVSTGTLFQAVPAFLGHEADLNAPITRFLVDAVRAGYLQTEEVSPSVRSLMRPRPVPPATPLAVRSPQTKSAVESVFLCERDGLYVGTSNGTIERIAQWGY